MPFLIQLIQEPLVKDKEGILDLLAWIADADPEAFNQKAWRQNSSFPELVVPASIPFLDHHAAVREGIPVYISLLKASKLKVRMKAAQVLSCFPEQAQELWQLLRAAFESQAEAQGRAKILATLERANFVMALSLLAEGIPEAPDFFMQIFLKHESPLLDLVAALEVPYLSKDKTPVDVVRLLTQVMLQRPANLNAYKHLAWGKDSLAWIRAKWALHELRH